MVRDPRQPKTRTDARDAGDPARGDDQLERFRDGDQDAFEELVEVFQRRLVQFFYRLCWDRDRAEDFTQSLFLKLLRGAARYRPEGKLSTYIFRIATNLWIDHYRSVRPRQRLYSLDQALLAGREPVSVDPAGSPVQCAEDGEERARLRAALEQLTEPHRLVFELAVYQQLPYAQIGEVLDIPVGTVKSRMHNSVRALRQVLGAGDAGGVADDGSFRASRRALGS